jgi:hypothetical protein
MQIDVVMGKYKMLWPIDTLLNSGVVNTRKAHAVEREEPKLDTLGPEDHKTTA